MPLRHVFAAIFAVLALAPAAGAQAPYPDSMAATGDSITRAFNTGLLPFTDAPRNSWSTGWKRDVRSHYVRILAANSRIFARNFNDARSGAKMADLGRQMEVVNRQQVEYVTVLMGANDACASSEAAMTPVSEFRAHFELALTTVSTGSPQAVVYVVSIPDVYRLWEILHTKREARLTWRLTGFCKSMLANPGSNDNPLRLDYSMPGTSRAVGMTGPSSSIRSSRGTCRLATISIRPSRGSERSPP